MTLLDHSHDDDTGLITETLMAAGRTRSALRYLPGRQRRKHDPIPESTFFGALSKLTGRAEKVRPWENQRLSRSTLLVLCQAQEALGRLDEVARRFPLSRNWGRAVRLREVQQLAHLGGVHVSLREVWQTQLPGNIPRVATEPALLPYLDAIPGEHATWWKESGIALPPTARAALRHLRLLGVESTTVFGGLHSLLVEEGTLRDAWLPLVNAVTARPDDYLAALLATVETRGADPLVSHFAHSVLTACRMEITLIDRVATLREHLLATTSRSHTGHILKVVDSLATAPVLTNRCIVEQHRITLKAAALITAALVDEGLLVRHPHCTRSAVFCNPQVLYLHSGLPLAQ